MKPINDWSFVSINQYMQINQFIIYANLLYIQVYPSVQTPHKKHDTVQFCHMRSSIAMKLFNMKAIYKLI